VFSLQTYNLGTGQGVSVLQLLRTFEAVTNTVVPFEIQDRRTGDIVSMYAKTALAERELGWKAKYTLEQMCKCKWHGEGLHVVNKCHCTSVELYLSYLHTHAHCIMSDILNSACSVNCKGFQWIQCSMERFFNMGLSRTEHSRTAGVTVH